MCYGRGLAPGFVSLGRLGWGRRGCCVARRHRVGILAGAARREDDESLRIGILERRLFVWVLGLCGLVGLAAGMWMAHTEEERLVAEAETRLRLLSRRYATELGEAAARKLEVGTSANAIVLREIARPVSEPAEEMLVRGADGAVRSSDGESGAFLRRGAPLDATTLALFARTEALWPDVAPLVQGEFFNFYVITEEDFIRISPPDWALEVEPEHDFRDDVFYRLADPEHNPGREPIWTPIYYDDIWKRWMTSLIVPLYDGDRFLGVTGSDVVLQDVVVWTGGLAEREGWGNALVFDEHGNLIAHREYSEEILAREGRMNEPLSSAEIADPGLAEVVQGVVSGRVLPRWPRTAVLGGEKQYICVEPVPSLGWYVGVYSLQPGRERVAGRRAPERDSRGGVRPRSAACRRPRAGVSPDRGRAGHRSGDRGGCPLNGRVEPPHRAPRERRDRQARARAQGDGRPPS